jgi:hypothetical protein
MSSTAVPSVTPVVVSIPRAILQLVAVSILALLAYYAIGVDQGMTSVLGDNTTIHEFVHDARHFLGFPCH